jgi:hypothetical protein
MNHLDNAIAKYIDFFNHLEGPPFYDELTADAQNDLCAACLRDSNEKRGAEVFEAMAEASSWHKPTLIADVINARNNWDAQLTLDPWGPLIAIMRCAAERVFEDEINGRIADLYNDYCQSNGVYAYLYHADEPAELIGWQNNPTEERQ